MRLVAEERIYRPQILLLRHNHAEFYVSLLAEPVDILIQDIFGTLNCLPIQLPKRRRTRPPNLQVLSSSPIISLHNGAGASLLAVGADFLLLII